ncbi:Thoeris anti-defense Tad2 family protein [Xenorhabdus bovienii]|uniref:Thoeris anti-defense Tad2 family protein n=1 Tax=Xenorhabdus bovienii TaxID=40576 RepID=UPI00237C8B25|nr:MW1434 family type I TA system toxin [Xenorhabdus bovienii]MDE1492977.1 DUF2829 domain-containing protein [Xenorhabdus bovienii]
MSDVNNPENNTALKCPFDPNLYNIGDDNITVPAGTSAWALSLVYLGKQVHRSGWNAPIEHMRLAHKSETGSEGDGAAYIEKSDKDGYWSRWAPTQEDLLACDWKLLAEVCPEDSMLVFDLKSGNDGSGYVGYMDNQYGTLNIIQNKVGFKEILFFKTTMGSFNDMPVGYLSFKISYDIANHQTLENLLKKKLYITIDDTTYNIGHYGVFSPDDNKEEKTYKVSYEHDYPSDIDKLYKIISQDKGVKRYHINWSDKTSPDLNNILEFDIKLGASENSEYYGYSGHDGVDGNGEKLGVFGTLNIIKNNTKIPDILAFYYNAGPHTFLINVPYDRFNAQGIAELFEKNLYITVDDKLYKLGIPSSGDAGGPANKFSIYYNIHDDSELLNLAGVLKKTGETKRLLLTWLNK